MFHLKICRKIFAFDKDKDRVAIMKNMLLKAGASCIELRQQDFLTVNPTDDKYKNVEYAIVDPSCSGSGTDFDNAEFQFHHQVMLTKMYFHFCKNLRLAISLPRFD